MRRGNAVLWRPFNPGAEATAWDCRADARGMPTSQLPGPDEGETSDTELLRRALGGDSSAFRLLIQKHDRHLYRIARSVLSDDHEAEDVVQETYLRAFTRLADFRGDAKFSTWLARIALNVAIRRRHRQR